MEMRSDDVQRWIRPFVSSVRHDPSAKPFRRLLAPPMVSRSALSTVTVSSVHVDQVAAAGHRRGLVDGVSVWFDLMHYARRNGHRESLSSVSPSNIDGAVPGKLRDDFLRPDCSVW
jgi:hypothetical protein